MALIWGLRRTRLTLYRFELQRSAMRVLTIVQKSSDIHTFHLAAHAAISGMAFRILENRVSSSVFALDGVQIGKCIWFPMS